MKRQNSRKKNFNIFTFSNSLMALAFGLFGPFYYLFINDMGGSIENFGIAADYLFYLELYFLCLQGNFQIKLGENPF